MGWGLGMHARMTRLSAHRVNTFGVVPQNVCALRRESSGTELAAVVGGVDWTVSIPNKALCQALGGSQSQAVHVCSCCRDSHSHTAARYSRDAHLQQLPLALRRRLPRRQPPTTQVRCGCCSWLDAPLASTAATMCRQFLIRSATKSVTATQPPTSVFNSSHCLASWPTCTAPRGGSTTKASHA
jgi:hypothetical protein